MKTILLLRHAKSDWEADYVGDHQRPLARRGRKASARVGKFLSKTKQFPELVLCSTALRAQETLEIAMDSGDWINVDVNYDNTIYHAGYDQLISCIRSIPDGIATAMIVGHEPTTSLLAGQLIGGGSISFPTATVARIDLNLDHWKNCRSGVGTLMWHVIPRHLKKVLKSEEQI